MYYKMCGKCNKKMPQETNDWFCQDCINTPFLSSGKKIYEAWKEVQDFEVFCKILVSKNYPGHILCGIFYVDAEHFNLLCRTQDGREKLFNLSYTELG